MSVNVQVINRPTGYYGAHLGVLLSEMNMPWPADTESVDAAKRRIENGLERVPKKTGLTAAMCYRAELSDDWKTLTIYHLNLMGDRDYIVAIITKAE